MRAAPRDIILQAKLMRTDLAALCLITAGVVSGCGQISGPGAKQLPDSNHGGVLVALPDKEAYVELLNGDRKKKGTTYDTTIIAYLLEPDLKTALTHPPTSVQVKVGTPKGEQVVKLGSGARFSGSGGRRSVRVGVRPVRPP